MKAIMLPSVDRRISKVSLFIVLLFCMFVVIYINPAESALLTFQSPKPPQQLNCGSMTVLFPNEFLGEWFNAHCDMTNDRSILAKGLIPIGPRFYLGIWTATGPARDLNKPISLIIDIDTSLLDGFSKRQLSAYIYYEGTKTWAAISSRSSDTQNQLIVDLKRLEPTISIPKWKERSVIGVFARPPEVTPLTVSVTPRTSPTPEVSLSSSPVASKDSTPTVPPTPTLTTQVAVVATTTPSVSMTALSPTSTAANIQQVNNSKTRGTDIAVIAVLGLAAIMVFLIFRQRAKTHTRS